MNEIERKKVEKSYKGFAAELKQRLGSKNDSPLLLPPQDYDTVHRSKGNLLGREVRKCLREDIVGVEEGQTDQTDGESGGGPAFKNIHEPDDIIPIEPRWKKFDAQRIPSRDVHREPRRPSSPKRQENPEDELAPRLHESSPRGSAELGSVRTSTEAQADDGGFEGDDLQIVEPRWKKGATYNPPPVERRPKQSHVREPRRTSSPGPRDGRRLPSPPRGYRVEVPEGGKKYTAAKLGLQEGWVNRGEMRRNASLTDNYEYAEITDPNQPSRRHSQHSQTKNDSKYTGYDDWKERGSNPNRRSQDYPPYN